MAYDSSNGSIFKSNYNSTPLSAMSDNNNTVIAIVPLQKQPQGIAFDSGKSELFITYSESNKVSVIADSADMPQVQTGQNLFELTAIAFILLVTAAGVLVVNLVHMKFKRRTKPPKFSSALD